MKKDRQEWKDNLQKGGRLWCRNQSNYLSDRIEISERVYCECERCTRDAFVYMNEKDHMDFKEIFKKLITNEIARAK